MKLYFSIITTLVFITVSLSQNKDVLFIAVDDLRVDLRAYGHTEVKVPHMDMLAYFLTVA